MVELLPTSNREVRATSAGEGPEKKHKVQHEFVRNKQSKQMNVKMMALIEESTRVGNLPRLTRVGAISIVEIWAVGIVGPATVLGSLGISIATRMTCKVIRGIYREMAGREEKEVLLRMKETYP